MMFDEGLSTATVHDIFKEEIADRGGKVSDVLEDRRMLFARGVFPEARAVRPGDDLQPGVAVRMIDGEVSVHAYVLRLVCRNGAVIPHVVQSEQLADLTLGDEYAVRQAIAVCAAPELFRGAVEHMRVSTNVNAGSLALVLMRISRLLGPSNQATAAHVIREFMQAGDTTRYGLINAVTAIARETADPRLKWRLEALGGTLTFATREIRSEMSEAASREATSLEAEVPIG